MRRQLLADIRLEAEHLQGESRSVVKGMYNNG